MLIAESDRNGHRKGDLNWLYRNVGVSPWPSKQELARKGSVSSSQLIDEEGNTAVEKRYNRPSISSPCTEDHSSTKKRSSEFSERKALSPLGLRELFWQIHANILISFKQLLVLKACCIFPQECRKMKTSSGAPSDISAEVLLLTLCKQCPRP